MIACNKAVFNKVAARSPFLKEKLHYVPHGLILDNWQFSDKEIQQDVLRFICIGRLVKKKNPLRAIEIIQALNKAGIASELSIVGNGEMLPDLKARADASITFKQPILRSEVNSELINHDILIICSEELANGDMEGLPNTVLEAMASGTIVMAYNSGSITEAICEETGFIMTAGDEVNTVQKLLKSDLSKIKNNARQLIEEKYSAESLIQKKSELLIST